MTNSARMRKKYPDMGATPLTRGVAFCVWAPHATGVYVIGTFNNWKKDVTPLHREEDGYWSAEVPEAAIGDEYKYWVRSKAGSFQRLDPYARKLTHWLGNGVIYDPQAFKWNDDNFQIKSRNDLVIYEMHVGTFNVKEPGKPGTFETALEKLPYLQELGVSAIEVLPAMEYPGQFSWGYNLIHLFAISSHYGGPDAFKQFVKAAHQHNLAVILDVVYNHLGPTDLDLWQFDGWQENDLGGIYFYNDHRAYTPWGDSRPNYDRAEVRQYLQDNVLMWFEEYHVDGLRIDATSYIRSTEGGEPDPPNNIPEGWRFLQWINQEVQQCYPGKLLIAEDLKNDEAIVRKVEAGGTGFDAQWDLEFAEVLRQAVISLEDEARDLEAICQAMERRYSPDAFQRVVFSESHDQVANGKSRIPEEISPHEVDNWFSKKRSTLAGALVLTAPAIPLLFQGQELLEDKWFHEQDALDWSRTEEQHGILNLYRDLIALRRNLPGLTRGLGGHNIHIYHFNHEAKLIAFHRWNEGGPGDSVVVVVNLAHQSHENYVIGFPQDGLWQTRFNSDSYDYGEDFANHPTPNVETQAGEADGLPYHGVISIGPYSVVIFSQNLAE